MTFFELIPEIHLKKTFFIDKEETFQYITSPYFTFQNSRDSYNLQIFIQVGTSNVFWKNLR